MNDVTAVRRADAGDAPGIAGVIAEAFHDLSVARWLVPDPVERAQIFPDYFRIFADIGVAHGEVGVVDSPGHGIVGTAVWFPMTPDPVPFPADYDEQLSKLCGAHADRFRELDAVMESNHPAEPQHYLALLGIRPAWQGRGLGSALLSHHHAQLDTLRLPAYLEASSTRSRDLYMRHGYRTHSEPLVFVPGARPEDGPAMWPLWRDPQ